MLKVVFFARVKEQLECGQLDVDWHASLTTVGALEQHIFQLKGSHWESVLSEDNIVRAVNHTVVTADGALQDGDEVAFFPPVTGG